MLRDYNDRQNTILNQLAYIDIGGYDLPVYLSKIWDDLRYGEPKNSLTAEEKQQLESLKIFAYENDNANSGFCAVAFRDDSGAVGMSFRGTEGLDDVINNPTDMIDNIFTSTRGDSAQSRKAIAFFNKHHDPAGNNYLYGHSKGGDLAMEVYVTYYWKIKAIHVINAQPINDSKLMADQRLALLLDKIDAIIIDGDFVGMLGVPGYKVRYIQNVGGCESFTDPHQMYFASFDENGYYIIEPSPYEKYWGQGIVAYLASGIIERFQMLSSPATVIRNALIRVINYIILDLPDLAMDVINTCKRGLQIAGAIASDIDAVVSFLCSVANNVTNWWNEQKAKINRVGNSFYGEAFGKDILIDEEAFIKASNDLILLSGRLQTLRDDIEAMLDTLKKGFDTPAGAKFYNSCRTNLLKPLDDQKLVIDHISQVLKTSKSKYQSVFDSYRSLNNSISSYTF